MVGTRLSDILAHDSCFTWVFIISCITQNTLILNNQSFQIRVGYSLAETDTVYDPGKCLLHRGWWEWWHVCTNIQHVRFLLVGWIGLLRGMNKTCRSVAVKSAFKRKSTFWHRAWLAGVGRIDERESRSFGFTCLSYPLPIILSEVQLECEMKYLLCYTYHWNLHFRRT